MRPPGTRRALVWAIVIAAIVGMGVGWFARKWYRPSPEERARERAEEIRERVRGLTH